MPTAKTKTGEFSYADYLRWPENERWQLLDGHAYAMAPPNINHQRAVFELGAQIRNQLIGHRCQGLVAPVGVRLPTHEEADAETRTVFEPDLVVVCDPAKIDTRGIRGAPDFIIEVLSPSTSSFDQIEKRLCYERAGVRELWLIDIPAGVLTAYRHNGSEFAPPEIRRADGALAVSAIPGMTLDLDFLKALRERAEEDGPG